LYVPCPTAEVAQLLAKSALHARLAACANIFPEIRSLYWWEGELQDDAESILILKTDATHEAALREHILEAHPYDVPCVASIALDGLNPDYEDWLRNSLTLE
jgi:periplasmic divalent cation tolerance protein